MDLWLEQTMGFCPSQMLLLTWISLIKSAFINRDILTLTCNRNITPQTTSKSNFSNTVLTQTHYIQ